MRQHIQICCLLKIVQNCNAFKFACSRGQGDPYSFGCTASARTRTSVQRARRINPNEITSWRWRTAHCGTHRPAIDAGRRQSQSLRSQRVVESSCARFSTVAYRPSSVHESGCNRGNYTPHRPFRLNCRVTVACVRLLLLLSVLCPVWLGLCVVLACVRQHLDSERFALFWFASASTAERFGRAHMAHGYTHVLTLAHQIETSDSKLCVCVCCWLVVASVTVH